MDTKTSGFLWSLNLHSAFSRGFILSNNQNCHDEAQVPRMFLVKLSKCIVLVKRIELPKVSETCEHSPVSGCVAQCGLGTNWIAASTHGAHCRYSSSWLPNYKIIIRLRHKAHSIQHTIWPAQHFLGMSSFRLLVNCLANTTRKYFMSTSELYNMSQPSCPSAAYTLTAGAVWRLQWVHTPTTI